MRHSKGYQNIPKICVLLSIFLCSHLFTIFRMCHLLYIAYSSSFYMCLKSKCTQTQKIQSSGIHQWNSNFWWKKKTSELRLYHFSFLINLPYVEYILLHVLYFVFMLVECCMSYRTTTIWQKLYTVFRLIL